MQLTTKQLKQLIKEELNKILKESGREAGDPWQHRFDVKRKYPVVPHRVDEELCKGKLKEFMSDIRYMLEHGSPVYVRQAVYNIHKEAAGCFWHNTVNEVEKAFRERHPEITVGQKPSKIYNQPKFLGMLRKELDEKYKKEIEDAIAKGDEEIQ